MFYGWEQDTGNLSATILKKVKFKIKTKRQQIGLKSMRSDSPSNAVFIHATSSLFQSRETDL
jgi:hypothetical protein